MVESATFEYQGRVHTELDKLYHTFRSTPEIHRFDSDAVDDWLAENVANPWVRISGRRVFIHIEDDDEAFGFRLRFT